MADVHIDRSPAHDVEERLRAAGCVAADEEARDLLQFARDADHLETLVRRRVEGEPLAWVLGRITFCGIDLVLRPGVYVPRWQTERVAEAALAALGDGGTAVDLCCGVGAVAAFLRLHRPAARVLATDIDPNAVACAVANGVDARAGDLYAPLPGELRRSVDVVVAVAPYVPTPALAALARTPEPRHALDGGDDGLAVVRRIASQAREWVRPRGALVLEIGAPQVDAAMRLLDACDFGSAEVVVDLDGDVCGVSARFQLPD